MFESKAKEEREKYVVFKKKVKVDIKPDFVHEFVNFKHISCKQSGLLSLLDEIGRSHYLLRRARKRKYDCKTMKKCLQKTRDMVRKRKSLRGLLIQWRGMLKRARKRM